MCETMKQKSLAGIAKEICAFGEIQLTKRVDHVKRSEYGQMCLLLREIVYARIVIRKYAEPEVVTSCDVGLRVLLMPAMEIDTSVGCAQVRLILMKSIVTSRIMTSLQQDATE